LPSISPELAARLDGGLYRAEVCDALWGQIPERLRLVRFDAETTGRHPAFSWHDGFQGLDLGALPEPMRRELAWCVWRAVDQGTHIHHAYGNLARRLRYSLEDQRAAGQRTAQSLMDRSLEEWERQLRKGALRRGLRLSGLRPSRWALRSCYRLLHIAYDPREWWEHEVWDRRLDERIPLRTHEPTAKKTINFLPIEQPWLRRALQWHGKVGLETGQLRWSTVCARATGVTHLSRFLAERGIDHPALAGGPEGLRGVALDFLAYLRSQRATTGPNRGGRLSDSHLVHVMAGVEQFYAFMADNRHQAADKLADQRWRLLGDEHARLWRPGEKPNKPAMPPEGAYLDDTAMGQIMRHVQLLGDPPAEGGLGDPQAMRLLMLLALTGRRISELCLLEFDCLLPVEGLALGDDEDGAVAKLRYQQTKIQGAPNTILVDRDVVAILRAQRQWALDHLPARADDPRAQPRYLFLSPWRNRYGQRPYSVATLNKKLAKLGQRIDIRDGQGRPVALTATRRFRHTKATSLLNAGVPLHVVQRYLGHLSPAMTMHYAQTLQQTHEREFLRFKKITADGRELELDPRDLYDLLELDKRADRVLPNGLCLLPPRQVCDRGNACLTCDKFATDATYLDEHTQQLDLLASLIERRRRGFRAKTGHEMDDDNVWLQQRRQEQRALRRIIGALERAELDPDSGQAIRGAGVDARTPPEEHG
jgi:integrase